ncbi:MAG TPA: 5-formyltetrahydrofolate cyclo-ligase [Gammaproteobacteria bacterium]
MNSDIRAERQRLRRRIRAERRAIPPERRAAADRAIVRHILGLAAYRRARRVAVFLAFDGEPSLELLMDRAMRQGKKLYVPVLHGLNMDFAPLERGSALARNFFGILEPPARARPIDPRRLDLVLTPLVAFDSKGVRIGVGRGYYDRCFAFLRDRDHWFRPKLLGVAYELQHVPSLERQSWDVPLWGVVTEAGVRRFAPQVEP